MTVISCKEINTSHGELTLRRTADISVSASAAQLTACVVDKLHLAAWRQWQCSKVNHITSLKSQVLTLRVII